MQDVGLDASALPSGGTSQRGDVPATYSADVVPTPTPITATSPVVAVTPSPPREGTGIATADTSARAGLNSYEEALSSWRSPPMPQGGAPSDGSNW